MKKNAISIAFVCIIAAIIVSGAVDANAEATGTQAYADVSEAAWYKASVDYVTAHGLMNGIGDNRFDPEGTVTRGMLVTILYRMDGSPDVTGAPTFQDVRKGSYYENAVIWATSNAVVHGYSTTVFAPDDSVTREQVAAILYRYTGTGAGPTADQKAVSQYSDAKEISDYARDAMVWAVREGLVSGTGQTQLEPKGQASRAQISAIMMRYDMNLRTTAPEADASTADAGGSTDASSESPHNNRTESDTLQSNNGNWNEPQNPSPSEAQNVNVPSEDSPSVEAQSEMGAPTIVVTSVTASPGDADVEVHITIHNNPGILGMTLSVLYDDTVLILKDAENGGAFLNVLTLTQPGKYAPQCRFVWDGQEIIADDVRDGDILVLRFDIADQVESGVFPIAVFYNDGDIIDNELAPITVAVNNGIAEIKQ